MRYRLQDLIDITQLQSLQERLNEIYSFPTTIIDNEGRILTSTGWQDICQKFHRQHPECAKLCLVSNQAIRRLHDANPAGSYRCPYGLLDHVAPIIIDGELLASFFTGQFFLEEPDLDFFQKQAHRYGFAEADYLEAVKKVPIWSKQKLDNYLFLIQGLIEIITNVCRKSLREIESRTESIRAEQKLIHAHQLMDYVISHARSAIAVHDKDLRYIYVSKRYLEDYKVTEQEIIGKHHYAVFPDLPQKWRDVHQRALRGEVSSNERDPYCRDDGSVEWTRWECRPWYEADGSIGGIIVYTEVITERVRAEDSLRESEARYRTLFEEAGDYVLLLEPRPNGVPVITDANEAALKAHGFSREELVGQPISVLELDISPAMDDARENALAGGEASTFEVHHRRKDGTVFAAEARARSLRLGNRDVILSIERDITVRKRAEQERQELQEKLQRAEKMEALGKLAGGVAHDLNNVLGVSMAYAELLREKVPDGSPLRTYVDHILKSTQKGAAIIQDLLTLARRGVSVSNVIRLNDTVSAVFQSPEFGLVQDLHPSVRFRTELAAGLLNMKGSPVHLEKTVFNLLTNAAEAISASGEVTVRTENRYLDRPIQGYDQLLEGDYVVLEVSDNGKGIRQDELGKIFEPFYTKKTMGRSGTGLGLAIVWGTVKDHNGYIDVQSRTGHGSTFTLYFPVTRETAPEADRVHTPVERYLGHGESVLVVDDVPEQRQVATAMLSRLGYRVTAVSSGADAVEYLRGQGTDILVLDMIMEPGIDGLETFKRVREINPGQKAIIVSGFSETARVKEAQRLGAGAYVKKPYIMENIGLALRQELDRTPVGPTT